jgi:hypothetical protein
VPTSHRDRSALEETRRVVERPCISPLLLLFLVVIPEGDLLLSLPLPVLAVACPCCHPQLPPAVRTRTVDIG